MKQSTLTKYPNANQIALDKHMEILFKPVC